MKMHTWVVDCLSFQRVKNLICFLMPGNQWDMLKLKFFRMKSQQIMQCYSASPHLCAGPSFCERNVMGNKAIFPLWCLPRACYVIIHKILWKGLKPELSGPLESPFYFSACFILYPLSVQHYNIEVWGLEIAWLRSVLIWNLQIFDKSFFCGKENEASLFYDCCIIPPILGLTEEGHTICVTYLIDLWSNFCQITFPPTHSQPTTAQLHVICWDSQQGVTFQEWNNGTVCFEM